MTTFTEPKRAGEFIIHEEAKNHSRATIIVASGQDLDVGTVLGQITKGGGSSEADAGNTGDGAMGSITVGAGAKAGDYRLTIVEPATNAGAFIVEDPDGINVGSGTVAVAFSGGGLSFTLADGATDFVSGDAFTITVAAGSGEYAQLDPSGIDGTENAVGVLYDAVDATAADAKGIAFMRHTIVNANEITWPDGITTEQKDTAIAQLKAIGILVR